MNSTWAVTPCLAAVGSCLLAVGFSATAAADAPDAVPLTPAYISQLAESMRTNQPALRALAARARAAGHATDGVRTWDDPMFRLGGVVASDRGPRLEEEGDLVYEVEQRLPLFGRATAARRMAEREREAADARVEMQFQIYRRDLFRLLFTAAANDVSLDVGRRDLAWLETMTATAETRYRAGTGSPAEVLRLQNERSKRAAMLKTEEQMREHTWVSIQRLLHRPWPATVPRLRLPEPWPAVTFSDRLVDYARRFEPTLRLLSREIAVAEAQVAVTRLNRRPEVVAAVEGRQYSGDGNFREGQFTVGLSLPWLNLRSYRSEEARDRARLEAVQLDRATEEQRVAAELHGLMVEIDAARREALLYREEILPRSRQALAAAEANWTAGRGMLLEAMEARRQVLEAEVEAARAVARQFSALAEVVLCCGLGDFEALETLRAEARP